MFQRVGRQFMNGEAQISGEVQRAAVTKARRSEPCLPQELPGIQFETDEFAQIHRIGLPPADQTLNAPQSCES